MPRIRKKTTKRGTTNQREKIKHKAAETRKKRKKEVNKNTQWKTKHPKDPGIPNNFPYKDQILAEVAEQRRQAAEEKQRRKEEKKAAKQQGPTEDGSDVDETEAVFDGVSSLTVAHAEKASGKAKAQQAEAEDAEEQVPILVNLDLPDLKSVLELADVIVEVLDAHDPSPCRSSHLEEIAQAKKTLFVLNKVDACPREAVVSWAESLRSQQPTVLFRSASAFLSSAADATVNAKGKGKERADDAWGVDSVLSCLRLWAEEKKDDKPLVVAVVGLTNTGKSSFINSLLRKAALDTFRLTSTAQDGPTTTRHPQEVTLEIDGKPIRLIDTPGLSWLPAPDASAEELERQRARDILLRNRGRIERLKDPGPLLAEVVSHANREDLMLLYNLPAFSEGDPNAFLSSVARANGLIKKGGALDLAGASRIVLRDWSTGKFARYTVPSSPASTPSRNPALADVYAKDEEVLSKLSTRKELRKSSGLVKLRAGVVDTRKINLDASWFAEEDESDEDAEGAHSEADDASVDLEKESADEDIDEDEDEDEDNDEEDEEDEEEEVPSLPTGKRKRGDAKAPPARPAKKVAFAPEPKGTKQARSAAGARGSQIAAQKAKTKLSALPSEKPSAKSQKKPVFKKAPIPPATKRAANSSSKKSAASQSKDGELAYDFKQFF
ncbi:Guanine nucleotide-binding protein-like NSN1 [Grifola frondosa]|uniref:Guanine nucleotide-binding protein-like NSN1 n=1 Tax=Grifola frondosa TaxID=5627 RepID=A0A1C7M9R6_GRIFR|nr:Guanine nucleotide-binding protein-like NSN1 [Grifola frondosa]